MGTINGLDHVDMRVPDVDAAVKFYCEGLGLHLKRRDGYNAIIVTPDGVILEVSPGGDADGNKSGIAHVCYNTFDVDATVERALAYGAVISRPENLVPYTHKDLRTAFVRAPSGEEIEFWTILRDGKVTEQAVDGCYIKQFVHVALTVPDMHASIRFYEGLGAKLSIDGEQVCSIRLPDMRELELLPGGEFAKDPHSYTHFSLLTDDVEAAAQRVVELGGKIAHEPYDWSNLRICFCQGVSGEIIEFFYLYQDGRQPDVFEAAPQPLPDIFTCAGI